MNFIPTTRLSRFLSLGIIVLLLFLIAVAGWSAYQYKGLSRFEDSITPISSVRTAPIRPPTPSVPEGVTRILLFSTGSQGLEAEIDGERLGIGRARAAMGDGLTDTLMLVTLYPSVGRVGIISIPRDTWLDWRNQRINSTYNSLGVQGLVDDVERLTGLRAKHAVSLNFAAFSDLTDALGGVNLEFDYPARDVKSKLDIPSAGCIALSGPQALSFVRSRYWQVYRNGKWRSDASSSDWGRIARQQAFVRGAANQLLTWQLPTRIPALLGVVKRNLIFDKDLSISTLAGIVQGFVNNSPEIRSITYPGVGGNTSSGASVIYPDLTTAGSLIADLDYFVTGVRPVLELNGKEDIVEPTNSENQLFDIYGDPIITDVVESPVAKPNSDKSRLALGRWPSCNLS